jgi:hypothetical protein
MFSRNIAFDENRQKGKVGHIQMTLYDGKHVVTVPRHDTIKGNNLKINSDRQVLQRKIS